LLHPNGDTATVRIFNTNTGRIIRARFPLIDGRAATEGTLAIPGVAGTGAPVRLDFLSPGGATTGRLLPTGHPMDRLPVAGDAPIEVSMVDAANACVFVRAADLGLRGDELPDALEANAGVLDLMQRVRRAASVAMGIAGDEDEAGRINGVPFVGFVAPPMDAATLSGEPIRTDAVDLTVRFLSNGQPHRALPLTASLCTAVAARIDGTVVNEAARRGGSDALRLGMPSGVLTVDADVGKDPAGQWEARSGAFYRTARRLFDGRIYVPS
jgi:2-methylaconitate isomerase